MIEKALSLMRLYPQLSSGSLCHFQITKKLRGRGRKFGFKQGYGNKGNKARQKWPALGFESGNSPFTSTSPNLKYIPDVIEKKSYATVSLGTIQLLIDTGRVRPPLVRGNDILSSNFCNDGSIQRVFVTEEGMDIFKAKIWLEAEKVSEPAIAAIEKNYGFVITKNSNLSKPSLYNIAEFPNFILKRIHKLEDIDSYYQEILAKSQKIGNERIKRAQKFGYNIPKEENISL